MIPNLYSREETVFTSEGLGRLVDCASCVVVEARNGVYECTFTYPVNGHGYERIKEGCYILAQHESSTDLQPFEIYMKSEPVSGLAQFNCRHISYQAGNEIVGPFTASSMADAVQRIPGLVYGGSRFTLYTDVDTSGYYELTTPKPLKQVLTELLTAFGVGEMKWNRRIIRILTSRGNADVATVRYGKNLAKLQRDVDYSAAYNAIVPFWADSEVCTSPGIITSGHDIYTSGDVICREVDFSSMYDEVPTQAEFNASAQRYFESNKPWIPNETIDFDFVALYEMGEFENYSFLQNVLLCDTVTVVFPRSDTDVTEKVVTTEYDVLRERYTKLTVGKKRDTYSELIKKSIRS